MDQAQLFISVLVIGEIRKGIENIRRRDPQSANHLDLWLTNMLDAFPKRIIDIDRNIAEIWGCMSVLRPLPVIDGLPAATAKAYDLTLVTRNTKDIQDLDVCWVNPFEG